MRDGSDVSGVRKEPLKKTVIKPRQKPVRRRSRRMTKLMAYYLKLKAEYLAEHPYCEVHQDNDRHAADQVHHSHGRNSTLLIDKRFFKGVCLSGHDFIQEHPDMARRLGLLCEKGNWNCPPNDRETKRLKELVINLIK